MFHAEGLTDEANSQLNGTQGQTMILFSLAKALSGLFEAYVRLFDEATSCSKVYSLLFYHSASLNNDPKRLKYDAKGHLFHAEGLANDATGLLNGSKDQTMALFLPDKALYCLFEGFVNQFESSFSVLQ